MYDEKLEALITAALADGVLTDKEENILFKKAEAMGIDLDEFELVLSGRLAKRKKEMEAQKKCAIPQELDELIKEFLTDGIISPKERQVLLNKAETLGLNLDEVDLYIDAQEQKIQQSIEAAKNMRKGKICPYCGKSIPELTDKCPYCDENITPEASKELAEIFDHLESALVNLKSGKEIYKSKAEVDRYFRKAKMYYGNNPKVKQLLEEVEIESEDAEALVRRTEKKEFWLKAFIANRKFLVITIIIFAIGWWSYSDYQDFKKDIKGSEIKTEEENSKDLTYVQNTAIEVNDYLENGEVEKAANALTLCEASNLGYSMYDNEQATSLYKSLVANVVDAYLDKGQKKKARNLVIACSSKFYFGKGGLSDLFIKLGSDGNYRFNSTDAE